MPLVAYSDLPAFAALQGEGQAIVSSKAAAANGLPSLKIGLLNLVPDGVFRATERQFMRLLANQQHANIDVRLLTVPDSERGVFEQAHIDRFYHSSEGINEQSLDALLITGANPKTDDITREAFWHAMVEAMNWGRTHVKSIVCSCLATHAYMHAFHGTLRVRQPKKCWGIYSHHTCVPNHPILSSVGDDVVGPHSHVYAVTREQVEMAGFDVLVESETAGVYLAASEDGLKTILYQGHPEYDSISLMKEYKRDITLHFAGKKPECPPLPENYFSRECVDILYSYRNRGLEAKNAGEELPEFPESELHAHLQNTWSENGRIIFGNWIRQLLEVTS